MSSKGSAWHAASDTPEQISMCLNCTKAECVDCISRGPDRARKDREKYARRRTTGWKRPYKRKSLVCVLDGNKVTIQVVEMLHCYPTVSTDREIGEIIHRASSSVKEMRARFGLPSAGAPFEEKQRLAQNLLDTIERMKDKEAPI